MKMAKRPNIKAAAKVSNDTAEPPLPLPLEELQEEIASVLAMHPFANGLVTITN